LIQTFNAKNPVGALWSLVPSSAQIAQFAASSWQKTKTYLDCPPPPPPATFQPALQKTFQEGLKAALETALKKSEEAAATFSSRAYNFFTSDSLVSNTNLTRAEIQSISQDVFERVTRKFAQDYFNSPEGIPPSLRNATQAMVHNTTRAAFQNITDAFVKRSTVPEFKQNLVCRTFSIINSGLEDASWIDKIKDLTVENIWNYISTSEIGTLIRSQVSQYPTQVVNGLKGELSASDNVTVVLESILMLYVLSRIPFSDKIVNGTLKLTADVTTFTAQTTWQAVKGLWEGAKWCYNHPKATLGVAATGATAVGTYFATQYFQNK
jgi:hypothetical protein